MFSCSRKRSAAIVKRNESCKRKISPGVMDVDGMLAHVGDFGKYQYILMFLFSLINILTAFHYFGQTFLTVIPDHDCTNNDTLQDCTINSELFHNTTEYISNNTCNEVSSADFYGYLSFVQEFQWICNDEWKAAFGQSVFFIGSVLGTFCIGYVADWIGRLHALVITFVFAFAGNMITIFSRDIILFSISRFIAGIATDNNFTMMYIIVLEYIRPSMRTFGLNVCIGVFYCLGCMMVPWIAVLLKRWDMFLLVITLPQLAVLGFYLFVPESAQWLISKGKLEQAIKSFQRIAITNKRRLSQTAIEELKIYSTEYVTKVRSGNLLGLFKTPKLRRKTLILIFKSMTLTLSYDAISKNINGLGYSPFILFTISSATILPACLFILYAQDRIGRKPLASGALLITGLVTLATGCSLAFDSAPSILLTATLIFIARLGVNVAYNSGMQYAVELMPTEVRGQGVSAIHVTGYAATFFSSHILFLSTIWKPIPEFILAALLITGAIACLFLPETLNRTLPISLEDGELFGEDERPWEFECCKRNKTASQTTLIRA